MKILRALPFLLLGHAGLAQTTYTHTLPNIEGSQLSSWVNFSFPNATATTGGGTLSFSWLACWQQVFGGRQDVVDHLVGRARPDDRRGAPEAAMSDPRVSRRRRHVRSGDRGRRR